MSGRHRTTGKTSIGLFALLGMVVTLLATTVLSSGSAGASSVTVHAHLGLTGVAYGDSPYANSPLGGSTVQVKPGDSVTFGATLVPVDDVLQDAHLGSLTTLTKLVTDLLGKGFKVQADFHSLGGKSATTLSGSSTVTFHDLKKGSYSFSYQILPDIPIVSSVLGTLLPSPQALGAADLGALNDVLGTAKPDDGVLPDNPISLSGATYSGSLVVTDSPVGGLSVQLGPVALPTLPDVVAPLAPVGDTVDKVVSKVADPIKSALPGPVKSLLPKPGKSTAAPKPASSTSAPKPSDSIHYTPAPQTVPDKVVPKGDLPALDLGSDLDASALGPLDLGGTGGLGVLGSAGSALRVPTSDLPSGSGGAAGRAVSGVSDLTHEQSLPPVDDKQIELASNPAPTKQLPVVLAICAILALAGVSAVYARLYMVNRS